MRLLRRSFLIILFTVALYLFSSQFLKVEEKSLDINIENELPEINQKEQIDLETTEKQSKIIENDQTTKEQVNQSRNIPPSETILSSEKIIEYTNQERIKNNLPPLKENKKLNMSAEMKISDMFNKQYFEHYSPEGKGVDYFVQEVNYEYVLVGENLAMVSFNDEKEIVDGWMKSLPHRENILNSKFQEIGVAVRKGNFRGREVWLAVQHFGTPISVCPQPNKNLHSLIDFNKKLLEEWQEKLDNLRAEIENSKTIEEYNQKVEEYNNLVEKYNDLLETTKTLINQYNLEVDQFNECMLKYK